jgi:WD40 repeat protein
MSNLLARTFFQRENATMRVDTNDFGLISGRAKEGPSRSWTGMFRLPRWRLGRIGVLLLGLIVLPWLPIPGPPVRQVRGVKNTAILTFAVSPDGKAIATVQRDGRVALRDATGGTSIRSFLDRCGPVLAMAFSRDGRSLAVGGAKADIFLFDVEAGGAERPLRIPIRYSSVKGLAFSPDGQTLAASSYLNHEILLWDLAAGRERARLRGHASPVISLAFSPDGASLASGGVRDDAIILWDLASGRPQRRLSVPREPVVFLTYSPDSSWLASTSDLGGEGRLWDLEGSRGDYLIRSISHARDPLSFSPDGRLLAMAGADGIVRLWDIVTGAVQWQVGDTADDRLSGVAFSPDGRLLAAICNDADIRLWPLPEILP